MSFDVIIKAVLIQYEAERFTRYNRDRGPLDLRHVIALFILYPLTRIDQTDTEHLGYD
jgi:hypothetical protein